MDQTATTDHSTDAFGAALRRAAPWIGVLMLLVLLAGAFILETHREVTDPGDSDAIAFVTGAHLMVSDPQQLYSAAAQEHVEAQLLHLPPADHFLNPYPNIAVGALLLSPLGHLDLRPATEIAVLVSTLLFVAALLLALRLLAPVASPAMRYAIAIATVFCLPAVGAIFQWDSLMTAAALGSALLAERRRFGLAGLVLATLILKPQVLWLVVPALIAARSWRYLGGLLLGSVAWMTVSLIITGPRSLIALVQLVFGNYPGQSDSSVGLPSLISTVTGSGLVGFIAAGCLGVLAGGVLLWRRDLVQGQPVAAVAIGLVLSLLCSPHVTPEDLMLCALPIAVVARRRPRLALAEALAISACVVVQLGLQAGAQHLEPLVLVAVATTIVLAARPRATSSAPRRASKPPLCAGGAGAMST